MKILALDTSSEHGSVAVLDGGELAAQATLGHSLQHSETLFNSVALVLDRADSTIHDVELFVSTRGPGSFTGLRVGMAAIESLAFTTGARAVAVSTLAALAWSLGHIGGLVAPILDARRGQVFGSLYRRTPQCLEQLQSPMAESPEVFLASLPAGEIVFCGPGTDLCRSGIAVRQDWQVAKWKTCLAVSVAEMADAGYEEPFEPLYLRPPTAKPIRAQTGGNK